jgi:alpha-L-rhamnosidase
MKKPLIILTIALLLQSCTGQEASLVPEELRCNNIENPVGTDGEPSLSWINTSDERGARQTSWHIILDDEPSALRDGTGSLWNSGKTVSKESFGIRIPEELNPGTRYYWKLRVWDENGIASGWSKTASFVTGLHKESHWSNAKWIGFEDIPDSLLLVPGVHGSGNGLGDVAEKRTTIPYFRKSFITDKKIKQAFVFVSGLGHYELYLNGKRTGDRFLAPGWTDYDKTCYFNTYDVTDEIKKGENVIGAITGNGFYNINRERYRKLVIAYGAPKLILKLSIAYADGTTMTIISDESWKTAPSPVLYTSIYGGEDYDARLEQEGWCEPAFEDSGWKNATPVRNPKGVLRPEYDHPVKIMQEFGPVSVTRLNDTAWLYDFGQNCSGIIRLKTKGPEGKEIRLYPGELINKDSVVDQRASGAPYYFSYILKGKNREEWTPMFTYYGFRYVQVSGAVPEGESNTGNLPEITQLKLLHTRNSSPRTGTFRCSSDHFNKIYTLIDWAIKSNMASVATDCPHREKLGWLEQTHLMGNSIKYVYDVHNLYSKIVDDMIEAQLSSGLVPDIAPEYVRFLAGFRDSPEWGSACIIVPWDLYEWFGDIGAVRKAYPMMTKYLQYLTLKATDGILTHGLGDWYDLGPKFPGVAQLTPKAVTATSIYYYDAVLVARMASILGLEDDAAACLGLAERIKTAFNDKFFDPATKVYSTGSQTAYSMPLFFRMVEDSIRKEVVDNLVSDVRQNNNALTAGDVGYRYLLRALEQEGYSQVIFDMNSKTDVPGYGFQLSKGATALTESWAGLTEVSNNHMMLGHLMEWFYSGLGGIRQADGSKAYEHILISPDIVGDIEWVESSCGTRYGEVRSNWKLTGSKLEMKIRIPVGCTATVAIPSNVSGTLEGGKKIEDSPHFSNIRMSEGKTYIETPSGEYVFTASINK